MTNYNIKRLAYVLAIQAEVEGMKAENLVRQENRDSLAYGEESFKEKAEELRRVVNVRDNNL